MCENPGTNPLGMHLSREREQGRLEGAVWMAAYIALGTWAAERASVRERAHRFAEANAEVIAKYGPTFARMYAEERHVCGLSGYDGMRDPPCPGCMARP